MVRLRRITSGPSWIPQIDGLRFVAIAAVVLFHCRGEIHVRGLAPVDVHGLVGAFDSWLVYADRGVPLFFVISGYILGRPFLRQHRLNGHPVKLGAYYMRRITRLEPPYVLSLLIYAGAELAKWHTAVRVMVPHLLASLFYVHNMVYGQMSLVSFVTWSLEVEVQFYVLAPLLATVYRIDNMALRRGILVLGMILTGFISIHFVGGTVSAYLPMLCYMQFFLAGFLFADFLEVRRHAPLSWRWDMVSVVLWPLIFRCPQTSFTLACLPILILPVYLATFYGKASNWFFRQPLIALTGGMCYSIYLTHTLIVSTVFRGVERIRFASGDATYAAQMPLLVVSVMAISTLYFVLVERPCMDPKWPTKLWHRLRLAPVHAHDRMWNQEDKP